MGRDDALDRRREGRCGEAKGELAVGSPPRLNRAGGANPLHGVAARAAEGLPGAGAGTRTGLVGGTAGVEGPAVVALVA